jgi:hypothetical protein
MPLIGAGCKFQTAAHIRLWLSVMMNACSRIGCAANSSIARAGSVPIHLRLHTKSHLDTSERTYRWHRHSTANIAQDGLVSPGETMLCDKSLIEQSDARRSFGGGALIVSG